MPAKMSRSAPRPPFRLREVSIAVRTLHLSCRNAGKAPIFTPVRESSGESRFNRSRNRPRLRRNDFELKLEFPNDMGRHLLEN